MTSRGETRSMTRRAAEIVLVPVALIAVFHGGWLAMTAAIAWALYEYVDGLRVGTLRSSTDDN